MRDALDGILTSSDELGLMAKFGENCVEHDAPERIILNAENAESARNIRRPIEVVAGLDRCRSVSWRQQNGEGERGAATAPLRRRDISAHRAGQLLHRGEPEAGAAEARCNRDIGLRVRPEQPPDFGERQADPAIGYHEGHAYLFS